MGGFFFRISPLLLSWIISARELFGGSRWRDLLFAGDGLFRTGFVVGVLSIGLRAQFRLRVQSSEFRAQGSGLMLFQRQQNAQNHCFARRRDLSWSWTLARAQLGPQPVGDNFDLIAFIVEFVSPIPLIPEITHTPLRPEHHRASRIPCQARRKTSFCAKRPTKNSGFLPSRSIRHTNPFIHRRFSSFPPTQPPSKCIPYPRTSSCSSKYVANLPSSKSTDLELQNHVSLCRPLCAFRIRCSGHRGLKMARLTTTHRFDKSRHTNPLHSPYPPQQRIYSTTTIENL